MRRPIRAPSIVPRGDEETVYIVEDQFGPQACVWRKADSEKTDFEAVIADLTSGQYHHPRRAIAFNVAERWSKDISEKAALEIQYRDRADLVDDDVPSSIQTFVDRHAHSEGQLALRWV